MNTPEPSDKGTGPPDSDENNRFNGAELSESVLGRDWNLEDAEWSSL